MSTAVVGLHGGLYATSLGLAAVNAVFASSWLFNSEKQAELFGAPWPQSVADKTNLRILAGATGLRQLAGGLASLTVVLMRDRYMAGVLSAIGHVVSIGDGLLLAYHRGNWRAGAPHFAVSAVTAVYTYVLLSPWLKK